MLKTNLLLLSFLCLLLFACKEDPMISDPVPEIPCEELPGFLFDSTFVECHYQLNRDSIEIVNDLQGTWDQLYSICGWTAAGTCLSEGTRSIELKADNTYEIIDQGEDPVQGTWTIEHIVYPDLSETYILFDPLPKGFHGLATVSLCDDQVMFGERYLDLCDMGFKRME